MFQLQWYQLILIILICIVTTYTVTNFFHQTETDKLMVEANKHMFKLDSLQKQLLFTYEANQKMTAELNDRNRKAKELINEIGKETNSVQKKLQDVKDFLLYLRNQYLSKPEN